MTADHNAHLQQSFEGAAQASLFVNPLPSMQDFYEKHCHIRHGAKEIAPEERERIQQGLKSIGDMLTAMDMSFCQGNNAILIYNCIDDLLHIGETAGLGIEETYALLGGDLRIDTICNIADLEETLLDAGINKGAAVRGPELTK